MGHRLGLLETHSKTKVLGHERCAQERETLRGRRNYPVMAPLEEYLIADRDAEVALARTAAPPAISNDATVLVLTRQGYQTAVEGKNGFVCFVDRSWSAPSTIPNTGTRRSAGPRA
jgi:hypothetical protein